MHIGGPVHLAEEGPGQETSSTGLGKGLGHIWAGSSGTSEVEQSLEGLGPQVGMFPCPVKRNVLEGGLSRGPLKPEAPLSLF